MTLELEGSGAVARKVLPLVEGVGKTRVSVVARSAEGASGNVCAEDARTRAKGARIAGAMRTKERSKKKTVLRVTMQMCCKR